MPEAVTPTVPAGAAEQGGTFRERTAQRLNAERSEQPAQTEQHPPQGEGPADGHPSPVDGSAEDVVEEGLLEDEQDGYAEEDGDADDLDAAALDEEAPADQDETDSEEQDDSTFEKRYEDLRAEFNRYLEQHQGFEREHAESMAQHLELRFELEDKLQEAVQRAEFLYNTMSGNANRFRNINWSQVPPDKVQEVQAQAQQALQMEQSAAQAFQQVQQQAAETNRLVKQREAAIAKTRLRRTIPNWSNETFKELREFATNAGMAPQAFNQITDPVVIEWAYAAKQLADAGRQGSSKRTTKRKAKVPTSRQPKRQPRNDRGQFARKRVEPNQRGSFADKHRHRLAMERQGR